MCKLCSPADGTQILECPKLVCAMGRFQTTFAQIFGKCKSICTCLPFVFLPFCLLPGHIKLPEPEQVGVDTPVVEFSDGFSEGVEGSRRSQENAFQPYGERLDRFCRSTGLRVDLDDVRGVLRTVVFGKAGHCALLQLFDPFDFSL